MHAAAMVVVVGTLATTPSRAEEPCDTWQHWPASDIWGSDLQQVHTLTLDECKIACLRIAHCRAFTWPGCQLKSSKERMPSDAHAVVERSSHDRCVPMDGQGHAVGAADSTARTVSALTVRTKSGPWSVD